MMVFHSHLSLRLSLFHVHAQSSSSTFRNTPSPPNVPHSYNVALSCCWLSISLTLNFPNSTYESTGSDRGCFMAVRLLRSESEEQFNLDIGSFCSDPEYGSRYAGERGVRLRSGTRPFERHQLCPWRCASLVPRHASSGYTVRHIMRCLRLATCSLDSEGQEWWRSDHAFG